MSQPNDPARSYNHLYTARKCSAGKRRFSVYWTWSYPWEANRDTTELDNRFSTVSASTVYRRSPAEALACRARLMMPDALHKM
jgi:hypothetical protein